MSASQTSCLYISEKVSKIRWIPQEATGDSNHFLTGSWGFNYNALKLWHLNENPENDFLPKCTSKLNFLGDISGLEFITSGSCAVSTTGGLCFYYLNKE